MLTNYASKATISIRETCNPDDKFHPAGITSYRRNSDSITTDKVLLDLIAIALAGLAAEEVIFGERSVGGGGSRGSDVEKATSIARQLVGSFGLGLVPRFVFDTQSDRAVLDPEVEKEVATILKNQYDRSLQYIRAQREQLQSIANELIALGSMDIDLESIASPERGRPESWRAAR